MIRTKTLNVLVLLGILSYALHSKERSLSIRCHFGLGPRMKRPEPNTQLRAKPANQKQSKPSKRTVSEKNNVFVVVATEFLGYFVM